VHQIVPRVGIKLKYNGKGPAITLHKNMKAHKVSPIYNLEDDDMGRIGYQLRDVAEEEIEEAS
jgi:hypothetical protein